MTTQDHKINERARYLFNKESKKVEYALKRQFKLVHVEAGRLLDVILLGKQAYPILATIPDSLVEVAVTFLGEKVLELKTLRTNADL
jgi:hypothetical protein